MKKEQPTNANLRALRHAQTKYVLPVHPVTRGNTMGLKSPDPAHNVLGVGWGRKRVKGKRQTVPCVTFYVHNKFPSRSVPPKHRLPTTLYGTPTDVVAIGELEFASGRETPAQPGESVEVNSAFLPGMIDAGTFGALLEDSNGERYLLSNNHVLAQLDKAPIGSPVYQPFFPDEIALLAFAVPLLPDPHQNEADAAVARVHRDQDVTGLVSTIGQLTSGDPIEPAVNRKVEKMGATTQHTHGVVESVNGTFRIRSNPALGALSPTFVFRDVVLIRGEEEDFCRKGDSGSLVVDSVTRRPMAMIMGRSRDDVQGVFFAAACPLTPVLAQLSAQAGETLRIHTLA